MKKGYKTYILEGTFKNTSLHEKTFKITQKRIKSKNLKMTIIDEEKKAIPTLSDKREDHLGLNLTIPHEYKDDYSTPLINAFKNNKIPSREEIKELLKTYDPFEFDFDYLEQY